MSNLSESGASVGARPDRVRRAVLVSAIAGLVPWILPACKVGPDYAGPPGTGDFVAPDFGAIEDPVFVRGAADLTEWWTVFDDPMLTALIEKAAADNRDLRIALSRVSEARSRVELARGAGRPRLGLGGGAARTQTLLTGFQTRTALNAGFDASWEIDVFGRIAREVEAADAEFRATAEDRYDVQVSLFAEVARAYLEVRALQARLAAAETNIASQREIRDLTQKRRDNGVVSGLDVAQAEQVLAVSDAAVPPLRIALAREINTIGVLVGVNPQSLHDELREPKPIPVPPATVTVGVPADVLRKRPDIRAAERRLAAQTARVGIATADLYPSFSLDGSFGFQSFDASSLLDAGSRTFALGPSFRWNLYDGGRIRSRIAIEDARVEQAVLLYERAVLNAMEEVESALTAFTEQRVLVDAAERAAAAARVTLRLATRLYREGLAGFQATLDAQRALLAAESDVARARGLASQSLVTLYKALGGGWDPQAVDAAEPDSGSTPG